eukprot:XP_001705131.1 Hypothetical protein GL50803_29053 [Giardia lamblia ATCC 50803]
MAPSEMDFMVWMNTQTRNLKTTLPIQLERSRCVA